MMLSIVIPVYNEQDSLGELLRRIETVVHQQAYETEVLLVDDGSSDASWDAIVLLSNTYSMVRGLRLRRNFGKSAALAAGFERASGQFIVTMDADLQDDPQELPNLLGKLNSGYDVVSGWKKIRHDPWHKVYPSRVFNGLISWLTGVKLHDHNCGLKAYRREALREVQLYGELHRFIPVLTAARGFRVTEIVVQHHPREHGTSKFGVERFIKGFLDLLTVYFITGYGYRPQHLLGTTGLACSLFGFMGLVFLSLWWIVSRLTTNLDDVHLHEKASFYFCIVGVLLGAQLLSLGFLAELITAQSRRSNTPYSLAEDTLKPPGTT